MDVALDLHHQERDLIKACADGEKWAQKAVYEKYYGSMMGVCLRYSANKEDALDILHDGFIKVFINIHKYKPGTSLPGWIRRIMINTSIDHYRKNSKRQTEDIEEARSITSNDIDAISRCSEQEILDAIQLLSPAYRMVFNLYVIEGYSHREVAELLQITESTSRSNLVKARTKLKNILNKQLGKE